MKRGNQQPDRAFGTFAFHDWIRDAIAADKPYDQFAREILGAVGDETHEPADGLVQGLAHSPSSSWTTPARSSSACGWPVPSATTIRTRSGARTITGAWRLSSAARPQERAEPGRASRRTRSHGRSSSTRPTGTVINKRTGKTAVMQAARRRTGDVDRGEDPRDQLVDWMVDAQEPVLRPRRRQPLLGPLLRPGIVDPLDDMRVTNPPSNPELLDALAKDLVDNKFSLKHLIRTICKSRTYQLSSTPNEFNKHDKQSYARYLSAAHVGRGAVRRGRQVTGSPAEFPGCRRHACARIGRSCCRTSRSRRTSWTCSAGRSASALANASASTRPTWPSAAPAQLGRSARQDRPHRRPGRPAGKDSRPDPEKVEELFLWSLGPEPNESQLKLAMDNLAKHASNKQWPTRDILWALLNSKAFMFNQ